MGTTIHMPSPRYSDSLQSLPLTATRLWDLHLPLPFKPATLICDENGCMSCNTVHRSQDLLSKLQLG